MVTRGSPIWGIRFADRGLRLVPLTSDEAWVRDLAGITIPDVFIRVVDPNADSSQDQKRRRRGLPPGVLIERRGALLFTHFGLSGRRCWM